jgi:hypothetical protein
MDCKIYLGKLLRSCAFIFTHFTAYISPSILAILQAILIEIIEV